MSSSSRKTLCSKGTCGSNLLLVRHRRLNNQERVDQPLSFEDAILVANDPSVCADFRAMALYRAMEIVAAMSGDEVAPMWVAIAKAVITLPGHFLMIRSSLEQRMPILSEEAAWIATRGSSDPRRRRQALYWLMDTAISQADAGDPLWREISVYLIDEAPEQDLQPQVLAKLSKNSPFKSLSASVWKRLHRLQSVERTHEQQVAEPAEDGSTKEPIAA